MYTFLYYYIAMQPTFLPNTFALQWCNNFLNSNKECILEVAINNPINPQTSVTLAPPSECLTSIPHLHFNSLHSLHTTRSLFTDYMQHLPLHYTVTINNSTLIGFIHQNQQITDASGYQHNMRDWQDKLWKKCRPNTETPNVVLLLWWQMTFKTTEYGM